MDMLRITNLRKSFGDKQVLKGLNLTVPQNSIFGFVGKNGAGKTTTIKAVLGLIRVDAGEIYVGDEPVRFGRTATNRQIGFLPDVPEFYPYMTAREYLHFCGELSAMEPGQIRNRSEELLRLVGLQDEKHRIKGYSRGMKQRLGIAQALLHSPKLLICDEPTSALDPIGRKEILDILLSLKEHTTVLFSTHILSDVERICTDVAFLNDGGVAVQGKLSQLKAGQSHDTFSLELPTPREQMVLKQAFPEMQRTNDLTLTFANRTYPLGDVLRFIADQNLSVNRLERQEPTLESLFMEVVEK